MSKYKNLFKNTALLFLSNFSSKLLILILVPIYTSVLTTSELGEYDLITSMIALVLPIISFNICEAVMRYAMSPDYPVEEISTIGLVYILLADGLFLIIILVNHYLGIWQSLEHYKVYVFWYFFFYLFYQYLTQLAKGLEDVKGIAIAGLLSTALTVVFVVIFLLYAKLQLAGFFLASILGNLIPCLLLMGRTRLFQRITGSCRRETRTKMVQYSVPLIFNSLAWWVNSVSDRYVVTWLCGLAVNGIYSVSYKIPSIMNVFHSIFFQAWQISAIHECDNDNDETFYQTMFRAYGNFMNVISALLILICPLLARFLFKNDFFTAWYYVPALLISNAISGLSGIFGPVLSARNQNGVLARATIYGALVNLGLNAGLVYYFAAQGAAVATAVSSFVIFECRRRALKEIFPAKAQRPIYLSWLLLILQCIVAVNMAGITGIMLQLLLIVILSVIAWTQMKAELMKLYSEIRNKLRNAKEPQ